MTDDGRSGKHEQPSSGSHDPPWPTMHPADDYDGGHHPDGGGSDRPDREEEPAAESRRMQEQLEIANDDRAEDGGV